MDYRQYLVDRARLKKYKTQLLSIATLTNRDIMDIWIEKGEEPLTDFSQTKFPHPMCLYKHMITRFHTFAVPEFSLDPAVFIKALHPTSQRQIAVHYKIYDNLIFEFFAHIRNGMGQADISELGLSVENWRSKSSIVFYFEMDEKTQKKIIQQYNQTYDTLIREQDDMRYAYSKYTVDSDSSDSDN
jgi:hypothetical protein